VKTIIVNPTKKQMLSKYEVISEEDLHSKVKNSSVTINLKMVVVNQNVK
jgi:hypothetical protein